MVLTAGGGRAMVVGSRAVVLDAPIAVYNLEVAGAHTYFVEDGRGDQTPLWVHNDCGGNLRKASARVHGNSLDYVGETHVYVIKGPKGVHKVGQSMQGVRIRDTVSIRGEAQARALTRKTGEYYRSEIRKTFSDKASACEYETRLIERYRRMFGAEMLPGNKTNR